MQHLYHLFSIGMGYVFCARANTRLFVKPTTCSQTLVKHGANC